jgi:RND family efflux transporter MFP subunit
MQPTESRSDHMSRLGTAVPTRPRRFPRRWLLLGLLGIGVALTAVFGIQPRIEARAALAKDTAARSAMTVTVIRAKAANATHDVVLPGNMQPFMSTSIHARTSGYLARWHADIGQNVKAGALLAEIDTPEIDDQLRQAQADVVRMEADYQLAAATATRWETLSKSGTVTRQSVEERTGAAAERRAALEAGRFQVARLRKLQGFKRVVAPFDGVITARNTDVGALIEAGSGTAGRELFHLAATHKLRVFVNVPQMFAAEARPGIAAELVLAEFPGRTFPGKLVRNTQSIDAGSRTLLAEVEVDNASGELLPGGYVEVRLKFDARQRALMLPVNALLFRPEGVVVGVAKADHRTALVPIKLGRDFGTEVEVVSGLDGSEDVILNPSDSLANGVEVKVVPQAPAKKAGS